MLGLKIYHTVIGLIFLTAIFAVYKFTSPQNVINNKIKKFTTLFLHGVTDEYCFLVLGKHAYIRNGRSHFVGGGDDYLIDNQFIEIGIGRVRSGYGDWGFGTTHSETSPLKITVDKDLAIQKVETDSFYNSKRSRDVEKEAKKIANKLNTGEVFNMKNKILSYHVKEILKVIPADKPIGHDVFKSPHMLDYYTK